MKKIFLSILLFCLLSIIFAPIITSAQGIVPCNPTCDKDGKNCTGQCTINDFFTMLANIYGFIVKMIATPLAVIALTVGGIFMLISAGNPALMTKGKEILKWAIIGLALTWGSWLIIDFVLKAIGYTGNWSTI